MKLVILTINDSDQALVLNGHLVLTYDHSADDDSSLIEAVANNLSAALNLNIEYIEMENDSDFNWDQVLSTLWTDRVLVKPIAGMTTILDTSICDWRLSNGHTAADLKPEHCVTYALKIEKSNASNQIYFSVYDQAIENYLGSIVPSGLHGVLEIRDGIPALSLGISPDENIIHVLSNTSSELAIIKENEKYNPTWMAVDFTEDKFTGLCFQVDDAESLMDARTILADDAFASYDFKSRTVAEYSGWEIEEHEWSRAVFFDNPTGGDSIKGVFSLQFTEYGTHIVAISEIHG